MSRIFSAKVQGGVIVVEGLDLPEGTTVTVAANDTAEAQCELSAEELADLDAAIEDADRNEPVPFEELLADFDRIDAAAAE